MPQMRQPQKPTRFRQFLFQDVEEKLNRIFRSETPSCFSRHSLCGDRSGGAALFRCGIIFFCLWIGVSLTACRELAPETVLPDEGTKNTRILHFNEKVIARAIARVARDQGFVGVKVESGNKRVETDYVEQGEWRTKIIATIEKISRQEREVTVLVVTEKKSSAGWEPRKMMGKEQYDKLFGEIEMQAYRELDKSE
jgi:hypothetical protein